MDQTAPDSTLLETIRAARAPGERLRVVLCPDLAWQDTTLRFDQPTVIGRESGDGQQAIADSRLSRQHVRLSRGTDGSSTAEDLGSRNGTWLNAAQVEKSRLRVGDVLRIGSTLMVLEDDAAQPSVRGPILGRSPGVARLRDELGRVAKSDLTVLIQGETGVGKELVAREVHQQSGRPGRLVTLNCAAIPPTLVESTLFGHIRGAFTGATAGAPGAFRDADRGTLFLDEVSELPPPVQAALLRAVEQREVIPVGKSTAIPLDVRIVAAANKQLGSLVDAGEFRSDLLARLSGVPLQVPSLAARRGDILELFHHFLDGPTASRDMTTSFAEALLVWDWPMNIRELQQLARRLTVMVPDAPRWELDHLPEPMPLKVTDRTPHEARPRVAAAISRPQTKDEMIQLLARFNGDVPALAAAVGRHRRQVYRWMKTWDIDTGTGR